MVHGNFLQEYFWKEKVSDKGISIAQPRMKILYNIDWVRSGWKGKYLALGHQALSPCAMTSGQIFSHPALPLSQ